MLEGEVNQPVRVGRRPGEPVGIVEVPAHDGRARRQQLCGRRLGSGESHDRMVRLEEFGDHRRPDPP